MTDFYNHTLHNNFEERINKEINIKNKIFEALELHNNLFLDTSNYPNDQLTPYEQAFPLSNNRIIPELTMSDYLLCLHNYRTNGNIFTIRYVHPIDKFCEVLFLNPNENGKIYLIVISPEFGEIEQIINFQSINLITDTIEGVYY